MPTVLFICTANQFRSPLAAAWFEHRLREARVAGEWHVVSAGTWTPAGQPAHLAAVAAARRFGLDLSTHRTREVTADVLAAASWVVVMEQNHREALEIEFPVCRGKISLLGEAGSDAPAFDIPDPARNDFRESTAAASSLINCVDRAFKTILRHAQQAA